MNRAGVYAMVDAERARQKAKWAGRHAHGKGDCSSPDVSDAVKVAVLGEEFGEVSRAFLDGDRDAWVTELVQVAAIAVGILEGVPVRDEGSSDIETEGVLS